MYYYGNIEKITQENRDYRRVLYTGKHMQLVVMSLKPNEEIGSETHEGHDQFIRVEKGKGIATFSNEIKELEDGVSIIIPSGMKHNIKNTGDTEMKLYTIYSPPEHEEGKVEKTKDMENAENVVALSRTNEMEGGKKKIRVFKFSNLF